MLNIKQTYRQAIHTKACINTTRRSTAGMGARFGVSRRRALAVALAIGCSAFVAEQRCAAQFPPGPFHDSMPSLGVFRLVVNTSPDFTPLVAPAVGFNGYPGYHSSDQHLTSPLLYDANTVIGRSSPHQRALPTPPYFPAPIDAPTFDTLAGYADYGLYGGIPFLFAAAPNPTREVLTEVEAFVLSTLSSADGQCHNPLVPSVPISWPMVKAGTGVGVAAKSLGIVRAISTTGVPASDFPAYSFFDIHVEVNLPPVAGTYSMVAFPAGGAVLTNGNALVVTNLNLTSLPPQVVYIHGNTNAVPMLFKFNNPPYWNAGDFFGYLVLSGHGTFTNDCTQEAALIAAALGTTTNSKPEMPVPWSRPSNLFPSPGSAYNSLMTDTNPPTSADVVHFTVPGAGTLYAQNLSLGNLTQNISPPLSGSAMSSNSNSALLCQLSIDGQTFSPAQLIGPAVLKISNNGSPSQFDTSLVQFQVQGQTPFGVLFIRESPTLPSLGQHSVQPTARGYQVSSFFDVFLELSTDGVNYIPADRSIRVQASAPPSSPGSLFIKGITGGGGTLQWLGPFTLQSAPKVTGPYTDMGAAGGPLLNSSTVSFGSSQMYFRLRQ